MEMPTATETAKILALYLEAEATYHRIVQEDEAVETGDFVTRDRLRGERNQAVGRRIALLEVVLILGVHPDQTGLDQAIHKAMVG